MPQASTLKLAIGTVVLLATAPVLGAGGGGGGGGGFSGPSQSAPSFDPAAEYRVGVEALQAKDYKKAQRAFRNVLSVTPRDANTNYLAGLSSAGLGDWKKAIGFYQKAIKFDPQNMQAQGQLGVAMMNAGDAAGAKTQRDALAAKLAACGASCANGEAIKAAIAMIDAALAAGPQAQQDVRVPAAVLAARSGDQAYLTAIALINAHRYADAIASLEQAQWAFGAHPDVLTYLGFANRKLGALDRAEQYYRAALAIAPDHRGALEYYGELKVERGDMAGARDHLARLERICSFGCGQAEELRRWIDQGGEPRG